jgi:hypothetical protein
MKNITTFFIGIFLWSFVCADTDRLVLGFDEYPPFTGDYGSPRVSVDLMERAMKRMNKTIDMIMVDPGEFERIFTNDRIEASPALWYSKERKKEFIFSNPYFENRLMLVGRKGSGARSTTLQQLDGKRVAVVEGYAYGPELEKSGAVLVAGVSEQKNMVKVLNGEVDFALIEEMLLTYARRVQQEQFETLLEIGSTPLITKPLHMAVKRDVRGAKRFIRRLNRELKSMLKDGTYHEIMGVGRLVADVDGDGTMEVIMVGDPAETLNPEEVFQDKSQPSENGMEHWFLVKGKLFSSLDDIPPDLRATMKAPQPTVEYTFTGL